MVVWVPIVTSHALIASSVLFPGISFGQPSAAPPVNGLADAFACYPPSSRRVAIIA